MKTKLLFLTLLFTITFCFSQNAILIKGKVQCDDFALQDVEVINLRSKKITKTDTNGQFSILAKANDTLMFVSKKYLYKIIGIKKEDLINNNLAFNLTRKPEELEEVVVKSKIESLHFGFNQEEADAVKIQKEAKNPKPIGVYDGTITNGTDFIRIGKMIGKLFVNPKEKSKNKNSEIQFKEFVLSTNDEDQLEKTLHLNKKEILLFLDFCDADPKSKTVLVNSNPLKLWDFLLEKNKEFKKLIAQELK